MTQALLASRSGDRVRPPEASGHTERDGVRLAWSSYGKGEQTILLMPTWSIIDSRMWKAQVPYLARHFRVVTFDGRGSGRSDRPDGAAAYADDQFAADAVAVLDAAGVDRAVVVGFSCGVTWCLQLAAAQPERVEGIVALSPSCGFGLEHAEREMWSWDLHRDTTERWAKYNRHYWRHGGYPDFLEFFFGQLFSEPHSTKQIEDCVGWALEAGAELAEVTKDARSGFGGGVCTLIEPVCADVSCPVLVLHGTEDRLDPIAVAERLAELTGGSLLRLEGAGHGVFARQPVLVNAEIRRFAEGLHPPRTPRRWTAPAVRPKRVLYISSPIGLGHARRDVAIASALHDLHPGIRIDWLAQHPVTRVLEDRGLQVHPASAELANESGHFEDEAGEHDLHAFGAIRRMDALLVHNFGVFADVVAEEPYDLVVGDEAWDVDHFLHENPELKRFAYAWFTDFVGWLPMPDGGEREVALTADYNAEMLEQRERLRRLRDRSLFVGGPEDIVPGTFGPGLPEIRDWTERNFDFTGYITGFDPIAECDRQRLRTSLGYRPGTRVCVVAVGGSGVGEPLLRRVLDAVPLARRQHPELEFLVVTGPRIDPGRLPCPRGAQVVGYLANLYEHLSACDVAVVQGGLTTCMELAAANRPFLYVPLQHHFEQNFHVRRRLERYRAGTCVTYQQASDPDALVELLGAALDSPAHCLPVETDGARRAATLLADLL